MKERFTDDDIIRFLYDEMSPSDSEAFLEALCSDEELWTRYESLQEVVEKLTGLQYEPSEHSVDRVKAYVHETMDEPVEKPAPVAKRIRLWQRIPKDLPLKAVASLAVILFLSVAVTVPSIPSKPAN